MIFESQIVSGTEQWRVKSQLWAKEWRSRASTHADCVARITMIITKAVKLPE
jgi:hypothetical protein